MPKCAFNNKIECDYKYRDEEFARQLDEALKSYKGGIERVYYSCQCMVDYRKCPRYLEYLQAQKQK